LRNCVQISFTPVADVVPPLRRATEGYTQGRTLDPLAKGYFYLRGWPDRVFMPADLDVALTAHDQTLNAAHEQ
jgi:hypothetical protein